MFSGRPQHGPVRPAKTFKASDDQRLERFYTGGAVSAAGAGGGGILALACGDEVKALADDLIECSGAGVFHRNSDSHFFRGERRLDDSTMEAQLLMCEMESNVMIRNAMQ
eukprot:scaffold90733_cov41-Prasinocladus_malaysianus.AAC.1